MARGGPGSRLDIFMDSHGARDGCRLPLPSGLMNGKAPVIDEAGDTIAPHVSVIVLNYNGRRWLTPCLDGLLGQVGAPRFEIVLVDNGSTDGSSSYVESRYPSVRIVQTGRNLGYSGGNNAGVVSREVSGWRFSTMTRSLLQTGWPGSLRQRCA